MRRSTSVFSSAGLTLALAALVACGPSQEEQLAAEQANAFAELEEAKAELDAKRRELADARTALAAAIDEGAEDAADQIAEMEAAVERMRSEIASKSDEFSSAIVDFINSDPPIEGEPLTESQLAGIRMKSSEDILVAKEHIEKGGDYRRAIDIYQQALQVDPDNAELKAALAEAEENRFVSEEKFSGVQKGMTQAQVRELLGQPNLRNIRDYPERKVSAWFYPTTEEGDAAGVWFRKNKAGDEIVYQIKFDAIQKEDQTP